MPGTHHFNLDQETIADLGLRLTNKIINSQIAPNSRVFEYPYLKHVYIMESDLYGNPMPKGSCFLAFEGRAGLMGKHIKIETLKTSRVEDIQKIVNDNHAG